MNNGADTAWIAERALSTGFDLCGVVRAEKFPELARTEEWLGRGYAGQMKCLADQRRSDPQTVMSGLRSVIVCALNYNSAAPRSIDALQAKPSSGRGWISRYAWGDDYHEVLQKKLRNLGGALSEHFTEPFETRIYSDTGPLNERVFAKHAGLGWAGKNTLLLNSKAGSFFFLGVILTTLDLVPTLGPADSLPPDLCGSCTKCIEACPTHALVEPYVMDSRLCISYLTIELRGSIPGELREPMGRHVFGCDICQDVCPWNRRAPVTQAEEFQPRIFSMATETKREAESPPESESKIGLRPESDAEVESLLLPRLEWLASLSAGEFRSFFRGSAIRRTKWSGLIRNACIALGNSDLAPGTPEHGRVKTVLTQLSTSSESIIAESAQWALSRIQ